MKKIVAVTACPAGVAHTYMAAKALEKAAQALGYEISIEKQGSLGIDNKLSQEAINNADYVIFATAVEVQERERFSEKNIFETEISKALKEPKNIINEAVSKTSNNILCNSKIKQETVDIKTESSAEVISNKEGLRQELINVKKAIFGALSYVIPLVSGAGLLMAIGVVLSISMGYSPTSNNFAWNINGNNVKDIMGARIDQIIWWIGKFGLTLMPSFLGGYVALAIAGKPGLAPGFVIGWLAMVMNGSFIGGITAGLLAGYIANFIKNTVKLKGPFQSLLSFLIIPLFTLLVGGVLYRYTIGLGIKELMDLLYNSLLALNANPSARIMLAVILGAMMCSDFGGPINKTAILFVYGIYTETKLPSTYAHITIGLAPTAIFMTYLFNKKQFNEIGKTNAFSTFILGIFGIGENTIPFAMVKPLAVITSTILGGATAAGLAAFFNLELIPTLGFYMALPFIPITNGSLGIIHWAISFFSGVAVSTLLLSFFFRTFYKNEIIFFEDKDAGFKL